MTGRRLIEEALPLPEVNAQSAREKSLRHGHISTMHLWWAPRPLAMSRAVVFGSLLPDPADEEERNRILKLIAEASSFEASVRAERIGPLKELLRDANPDGTTKVLDCFAGGGAIPLEALRLGCDVTAMDLNPVAYLREKCVLEYPQLFGHGPGGSNPLADDFVRWGNWVRKHVEPDLHKLFPAKNGKRPATYFWARTMECSNPSCRAEIPLLSSFWVANSSRRKVWVEVQARTGHIDLKVRLEPPPEGLDLAAGTVRSSSVVCPACGNTVAAREVRRYGKEKGFGRLLYAVMELEGGTRAYRDPRNDEKKGADELAQALLGQLEDLPDGSSPLPDEEIAKNGTRIHRCFAYGYDTWTSLFNERQLYVLSTLCRAVQEAHAEMISEGMPEDRARALATYLGLLVDKVADYNSAFTTWRTTAEASRSTFPRQRISMAWDYVETDPFHAGGGIWSAHIRWIELAIRHCSSTGQRAASVERGDAQQLPFADGTFDAVVVDPPYYDAIQYADLSDFFYVWLKRSIGHLYPDVFSTPLAPKRQEIVENNAPKASEAHVSPEEFDRRMAKALRELRRVVKPDGVVSIVFAHTDVEAWEHLLRGLRASGLVVSTSWPMRSEREGRSTAQVGAVLGSSVVLVCRPQSGEKEGFYDDVVRGLEARVIERLDAFEAMGLSGADYFVSAVGPAFEVFAQYSKIIKLSGEEVDVSDLMVLARQAVAQHAMRRLLGEDNLAALDGPSLFYLTWRWAYLTAAIPADEAYKLERAFDVDLGALSRPGGFAKRAGSNFLLLGPEERKDIKLPVSPSLIDVLHIACRLWDSGRRKELEELLGATSMGNEPGFWATARALAEILPDDNKERTMLLGLSGNRDALSAAAAKSTANMEELKLFT